MTLLEMYHRVRDWLFGTVSIEVMEPFVPEPEPEPEKVKRKYTLRDGGKNTGPSHYYLGDLLDRLDYYFRDIKMLRKANPYAYDLFSRIGATVLDSSALDNSLGSQNVLAGPDAPSLGCMFVDDHNEVDENGKITEWAARFMYFQKVKRPINVQYTDKNVYAFGMSYHDDKKKLAGGEEFHIEVSDDGSVRVLKECYPVHYAPGFCRMEWALPKGATSGYAYQLKKKRFTKEEVPNVHKYVEWVVKGFSEITLGSEMGMTVRVKKGNDVAAFAIDLLRTPYFFADRDRVVNENGKTRRIIHIVRTHRRKTKTGEVFIRSHFRGLRKFNWNGYQVSVGMGGKHQVMLQDATFNAYPDIELKDRRHLDAKAMGEKMGAALFGGHAAGVAAFKDVETDDDEDEKHYGT